jgi:hypothetical protein
MHHFSRAIARKQARRQARPKPPSFSVNGSLTRSSEATTLQLARTRHLSGVSHPHWNTMSNVSAKVKEEIYALIPPMIFFFIALNIIALIRALMLKGTGIAPSTPLAIALAALILAKAVLLADLMPAINRYPEKPLIYNVLWKTLIYSLMATAIHYLERLIDFWRQAGGFVAGNRLLLERIVWAHFWAIEIIIVVLVFNYCLFTELASAMGPKKLWQMVLGPASPVRS